MIDKNPPVDLEDNVAQFEATLYERGGFSTMLKKKRNVYEVYVTVVERTTHCVEVICDTPEEAEEAARENVQEEHGIYEHNGSVVIKTYWDCMYDDDEIICTTPELVKKGGE